MSMKRRTKGKTFLFLLLWLLMCFHFCFCVQEFEIQPSDVTVKRGESVNLPCKIKNQKGILQWTMNGFGLGTDRELRSYTRYMMLGTNETGNYTLHITAALLADEAEYQCQVSSTEEEPALRSASVKLTVLYPPKDDEDEVFITPESPVQAIAGATVRVTCRGGLTKPVSTITWTKNNVSIPSSEVKEIKKPLPNSMLESIISYINLKPDSSYHKKNISCHVSHPALERPIIRTVTMSVQFAPTVTIAKHFIKAREGDDLKFTCAATGNPPNLRFSWEVNGSSVAADFETEFTMRGITRKNNRAVVSCTVANSVGPTKAEETINVEYEPIFIEEPKDVDEDSGKKVALKCLVDSNPPAEIVWTHENSQKVIGHGAEWSLLVDGSSKGRYRCRVATPGFPEISRSIEVFLRSAPMVLPDQSSYGLEGERVSVECEIQSIPRPEEVIWSRNGVNLDTASLAKYDVEEVNTHSGIRSTLRIVETLKSDFGPYNCTAKNSYGSHTATIELIKRQSFPLVMTLVAIIGGIIFMVVVVIIIILFKMQGRPYKDNDLEKHTTDSSTQDSVLKADSRTVTGSDVSPSEDDGDYSHEDEWENSDTATTIRNLNRDSYRYSGEFVDPTFPPKTPNTPGAGYIPYVDYNRDYNPPIPSSINYNRNSLYSSVPLNNVDPRYSAAYGNPYLRVPQNPRVSQNIYSSNTLLSANEDAVSNSTSTTPVVPPTTSYQTNNLNNANVINKNIYSHLNRRNNNLNSQYVTVPQTNGQRSVLGTHI